MADTMHKPISGRCVSSSFAAQARPLRRSGGTVAVPAPQLLTLLLVMGDVLSTVMSGVAAMVLAQRVQRPGGLAGPEAGLRLGAGLGETGLGLSEFAVGLICALCLVCYQSAGLYRPDAVRACSRQIVPAAIGWSGVFLFVTVLADSIGVMPLLERGRPYMLELWYAGGLVGLMLTRRLLAWGIGVWERAGQLGRRTLLVGADQLGRSWLEDVRRSGDTSHQIVGVVAEREELVAASVGGAPVLGTMDDLVEQVRRHRVEVVVIALPWSAEADIAAICERLRATAVDIRLLPHALVATLPQLSVDRVAGVPLLGIVHRPLAGWNAVVKRTEDLAIGMVALLALAPLLACAAAAIKLESPGPVLFRQKRFGFNNEEFEVWKFRTMYVEQADRSGAQRTVRNDPRVTRVGRFLRRTSIDELPQLFNVLSGDMSIVGPRPHPVAMMAGDRLYHEAVKDYAGRHRVRPGITGWAQVNGLRGEVDTLRTAMLRVEHDLYYIDHWSVLFDLTIIARTVLVCINCRNAY